VKALQELAGRLKPKLNDVVGIDITATGTVLARLHRTDQGATLVAADILPSVLQSVEAPDPRPAALDIPSRLRGKYGAIAISTTQAALRLVSLPGSVDAGSEAKLVEGLGLERPADYRIGHKILTEGHGRSESRVLVVALPEQLAAALPKLLPSGFPVPHSVELAELAVMSAFSNTSAASSGTGGAILIDFGETTTLFAVFNRNALVLVRRFDVGAAAVLAKTKEAFGVDEDTAFGILCDSAFDVSQLIKDSLGPMAKQMVMGRDFVERRENCRMENVFVSGGLAASPGAMAEVAAALGTQPTAWSPFDALSEGGASVPDALKGYEWRFSAAIGAALSTFGDA
jgi:Tfp pilus assembly PilM family ATPase